MTAGHADMLVTPGRGIQDFAAALEGTVGEMKYAGCRKLHFNVFTVFGWGVQPWLGVLPLQTALLSLLLVL